MMTRPRLVLFLTSLTLLTLASVINLWNWNTAISFASEGEGALSSSLADSPVSRKTSIHSGSAKTAIISPATMESPPTSDISPTKLVARTRSWQRQSSGTPAGLIPFGIDKIFWPTSTRTPRPSPRPTSTPSPTPSPSPTPASVNGISAAEFIRIDTETEGHIREIAARGQTLGRDPRVLSRIGASIIETDQFLVRIGQGEYELGPFSYLQPVIDNFADSFTRNGVGIRRGLGAWGVLDPAWANRRYCGPNETMIACEFRLNNPSAVIIVLGTNDTGSVEKFEENMGRIVEFAIDGGVVPILVTKADRYEGGDNRNNEAIRRVASQYRIPLWDFDIVAGTLPGRGMGRDNVHLTYLTAFNYNNPTSFQRGYGLYNLTALMVLDKVWQEMKQVYLED